MKSKGKRFLESVRLWPCPHFRDLESSHVTRLGMSGGKFQENLPPGWDTPADIRLSVKNEDGALHTPYLSPKTFKKKPSLRGGSADAAISFDSSPRPREIATVA